MESLSHVSRAKALLLAVAWAIDGHVDSLRRLVAAAPSRLSQDVILRLLLTYLPESIDPGLYVPLLEDIALGRQDAVDPQSPVDLSAIEGLSENDARAKVRKLRLRPLRDSGSTIPESSGTLTAFLVHRARRIDAQTGVLSLVPQLISPFLSGSEEDLLAWLLSYLLPVLRHNYEYYPHTGSWLTLAGLEALDEMSIVKALLSSAKSGIQAGGSFPGNLARDLRGLVGPWVRGASERKRRKLRHAGSTLGEPLPDDGGAPSSEGGRAESPARIYVSTWDTVFECLFPLATEDFEAFVETVKDWDGPQDVDLGDYRGYLPSLEQSTVEALNMQYGRTIIAAIYAAPRISERLIAGIQQALAKLAALMGHDFAEDLIPRSVSLPDVGARITPPEGLPRQPLSMNNLVQPDNPLTHPNQGSLDLLHALLVSCALLSRWKVETSIRMLADIYLFATKEVQQDFVVRCLRTVSAQTKIDDSRWLEVRKELLWLWRWAPETELGDSHGLFNRVDSEFLEKEMLRVSLQGLHYRAAVETYLRPRHTKVPLSKEQVEQVIADVAMNFFDNATNCDRTRGGLKKASDTITFFYPAYFPQSVILARAERLLAATHALSPYALTLQHGVPFRPVTIRVHQDPVSLLGKLLEQNRRSYLKLVDLLAIGRDFVGAGLLSPKEPAGRPEDGVTRIVERRIICIAIEAALAEDDLETAHRYVLDCLPPGPFESRQKQSSDGAASGLQDAEDDLSWRAAFQAGRYRPKKALPRAPARSSSAATPETRLLEMRLELLGHALLLAPSAALSGILTAWQQCEEQLNLAVARETEAELRWDDRVDQKVPGQFMSSPPAASTKPPGSAAAADEDTPLGLFDVARGAAAALSRSAFPLRGPAAVGQGMISRPQTSSGPSDLHSDSPRTSEEGRLRKRDMVSNLVTGGLASGIGWVLGATPVTSGVGHESQ